ncbi:putative NAD-specific glutamate dehydrogenase [Halalkalicoccus jeotgali B3]|uniref:Putative NAD-specific glutamate dehydrogenase n=1 Tax=Halalkalicoccus jeotgali (strain DSM 18796 / CECT 7217 / JCM 14584 / KCTC 4019 / B3) TaxID=795797 RepID=L9VLY1_HALJB|nr:putative NAD-specific glutamate dehydrogenase [Halalkalicoccus jeotgali B3]
MADETTLRVVFVYVLKVRVDVLAFLTARTTGTGPASAAHVTHAAGTGTRTGRIGATGTRCALGVLVHLLADLLKRLAQVLGRRFDLLGVGLLVLQYGLDFVNLGFDLLDQLLVEVLLVLLQQTPRALNGTLGVVARLDALAPFLVLLCVLFGLVLHAVDLLVREARAALDGDLLFVARALVLGLDVDDAVLVDVEADLDLGGARGRRRDSRQHELPQELVVLCHLALALEHPDLHGGLVVRRGGEDLRLLGRDGGVLLDEPFEQAALDLDPERQGRHVEQHDVVDLAAEDAALDRRAQRDGLVGVDVLFGLLVDDLLDFLLDLGHPGRATDEDDLVDLARVVARIGEGLLGWGDGPLDQIGGQRLEGRAGQRRFEVDRARIGRRDEGQVDVGLLPATQLDLGLLGGVLQALEGLAVLAEVDPVVVLELLGEVVDDRVVPVVATQIVVPVGRDDLVNPTSEIENGDVEGSPTEVVDENGLVRIVVEPVGHRGGGRLVDDALDLEAGDLAGVLRRLALLVVEVRWHRDDGLLDVVAEVLLGVAFNLLEDHRRELFGRVLFALDLDGIIVLAHVAFDRGDRPVGVLDRLVLRRFADEPFAVVGEGDDRRCRPVALAVDDDLGIPTFHDRKGAVGGPEIDTENLVTRHCWPDVAFLVG